MKNLVLVLLISVYTISTTCVNAQTGVIKGTVKDENGEALIGATVIIEGTTKGAVTDFDGNFRIENISYGKLTLVCSYISFDPVVKSVNILSNSDLNIDFILSEAKISLDEVHITAKANRQSENFLMLKQKESIITVQSMGAHEISRKGVSDAEGAVIKISGISKQEGVKNVFVRGLGDRYNATSLNGFVVPSEDPEYKNISLSFFTNNMIQAINVNKMFSSSKSGDVGGALIDIESKELIKDTEFEIEISSGFNSQVMGIDYYGVDGINNFGYTGYSGGPGDYNSGNEEQINDGYSFEYSLDPVKKRFPFNKSISLSFGKKFLRKHRFFVVGSYDNDFEYHEGYSRLITATNAENPFRNMTYKQYTQNSSHLFLGHLELNYPNSRLYYNSLYIHTNSGYTSDYYGKESESFQSADKFNSEGLMRRQQINDNTVFVNQLVLNGNISQRLKYNIGASLNNISGNEPDRRIFQLPSIGNGMVELALEEGRNERFNSNIKETAIVPKINLQYRLSASDEKNSFIELGYDSKISYKEFSAPIYNHIWTGQTSVPIFEMDDVKLDPFINNQAISNLFLLEFFNDFYDVTKNIHSGYIDFTYQLSNKITTNAGIRADNVFVKIDYEVNRGADKGSDKLEGFFISPSFNIKYEFNDKNHIRMGFSRTYTLPQDKEKSPFIYQGIDGKENGNPDLEASTNNNFDIKWDHYISSNEIFSVNGFYKYILKPIARVDQGNSAGLKTFDNVSDHAIAAGIEAEFRKKIYSHREKHNFYLGLNASYIYSKIELDPVWYVQNTTSALEGSAPYIINSDFTYILTSGRFNLTSAIVLNYLSDKVHTIGTRGFNNLIEESFTTLDFINSLKISNHLVIAFKVKNLLNPEYKLTRKGTEDNDNPSVVNRSYKKGISLDLGVTYKF